MTAQMSSPAHTRAAHLGPERRRPQVLDAARSLAVRDGISNVTIGSIAVEMGVTRPVVYACYRDRIELLSAMLDREEAALTAEILQALHSSADTNGPEEAFVHGFTALLRAASQRADSWRLLLTSEPDLALAHRMAQARALITQQATAWIKPAMERWWKTADLDRKIPVLIELFMASCESGIRSMLDPTNDWTADDLGPFLGSAIYRTFAGA